jgi:23S rRNA pseudouridine1911/1915/1917 synthase
MNIHTNSDNSISLMAIIPESLSGERLDRIAAELFADYSRSVLQNWIKEGVLQVNGKAAKAKDKFYVGALLTLETTPQENADWLAEDIHLNIVYEDDAILVINKPLNLVVHPAAGNPKGTVMNAILYHYPAAATLPRAGIVHRLDKDTTGLMVVAKTLPAHHALVDQLQQRHIKREYEAIVFGEMTGGGTVDAPIGRHPHQRTKMAVEPLHGKAAVTHYRLKQRFPGLTHIEVSLETGRTHQIRVHMAHIHHPIVGDPMYAGRRKIPAGASQTVIDALKTFPRQALHARKLGLLHPVTGEWLEWEAELPDDMQALLDTLNKNT